MEKLICANKRARRDYAIDETYEAGMVLVGTEVKALRQGKANLKDSYAVRMKGELFLNHMHISPFEKGSIFNHDPYRTRKLLLHRKEILRLGSEIERKHLTLIPLSVYFKKQWVKLEIGLCRGRKKYDKRQK